MKSMSRGALEWQDGVSGSSMDLQSSTLITYYSGMKKDPKYAFLHAFFLIYLSCSFQNCLYSVYDQKHTLFSNFARFWTPKRCTRVQCLVLKNNPNYVIFWTSLIVPLDIWVAPRDLCKYNMSYVTHQVTLACIHHMNIVTSQYDWTMKYIFPLYWSFNQ